MFYLEEGHSTGVVLTSLRSYLPVRDKCDNSDRDTQACGLVLLLISVNSSAR